MDPFTHGIAGATLSQLFTDKKEVFRTGSIAGFASALLADADIFISSSADPLINLEIHRQFTHSLLFIPAGALIATVLLWWFTRKQLTFKQTYIFSLCGYATAGMMDYFTSYGVHLLWPFTDVRYSLDIISVFDPLFTLGIFIFAGFAYYKRQKIYSFMALGWMFTYLLFGFSQQHKALTALEVLRSQNGHQAEKMVIKPTIANQLLWSARYIHDGTVHSYGIRLVPFTEPYIYEGETAELLDWKNKYSEIEGTTLYNDIQRFSDLSNGYLIIHPKYDHVIGDARYSILPTTLSPLWGIVVDTTNSDQHVEFGTYRDTGTEVRQAFIDMLMGKRID